MSVSLTKLGVLRRSLQLCRLFGGVRLRSISQYGSEKGQLTVG